MASDGLTRGASILTLDSRMDLSTFFRQVAAEFGTVPKSGLAMIGAASLLSATIEVLTYFWPFPSLTTTGLVFAALAAVWAMTTYSVSLMMSGTPRSLVGFAKYASTALATFLPVLLAVSLLLVGAALRSGWLLATGFVLLMPALLLTSMLAGWPVLQASTRTLIGPISAFRLTRGIRWPLVLTGFFMSAINRAVPSSSPADDLSTVVLLAAFGAVATAAGAMLFVSVAVVASRSMATNRELSVAPA